VSERRRLPTLPPAASAAGELPSEQAMRHRHEAVAAATRRTHHAVAATGATAPRDERYRSDDPALDRLWLALHDVSDPELPVSLVDLGLICGIRRRADGAVEVDLTFTATACPCMEFIHADIRERLLGEAAVSAVEIREVWDPPWTAERMTEAGRALLRQSGVAA
jgi:metal-sulfur cluster biosynthetic enzyme